MLMAYALRKACTVRNVNIVVRITTMKRAGKIIRIRAPIYAPARVVGIMIATRS